MAGRGRSWAPIFMISALAVLLPSSAHPLNAAVRRCGPVVSSQIVRAPEEQSAKMQAIKEWMAQALSVGPGFDSWRLAVDRVLKCFPVKEGGFDCMAVAAPCVIQNNPNASPADSAASRHDF